MRVSESLMIFLQKPSLGPVDIAAHFSLIGDSLVNLGTRLQEHKVQNLTLLYSINDVEDNGFCDT